jgi:hypothetical protein
MSIWWHRKALNLNVSGIGVWVQQTSLNNPWIFGQQTSWFVCDASIISKVAAQSGGRSIYLATSSRRSDGFIEKAIMHKSSISGLIWDYEQGHTAEEARFDLGKVHAFAKSNNLFFGVAALVVPSGSKERNGVDYAEAKTYCDFLMPMLYPQWHNHNPKKTLNKYKTAIKAASVPLLPIIAYQSSSEKIPPDQATLTSQRLLDNFTDLRLDAICVWNCGQAGQRFWSSLGGIVR